MVGISSNTLLASSQHLDSLISFDHHFFAAICVRDFDLDSKVALGSNFPIANPLESVATMHAYLLDHRILLTLLTQILT